MSYRDNLTAALEKVRALDIEVIELRAELRIARERIDEYEKPKSRQIISRPTTGPSKQTLAWLRRRAKELDLELSIGDGSDDKHMIALPKRRGGGRKKV